MLACATIRHFTLDAPRIGQRTICQPGARVTVILAARSRDSIDSRPQRGTLMGALGPDLTHDGEVRHAAVGDIGGGGTLRGYKSEKGQMMSNTNQMSVGTVASLWRYPVKSMMGEELNVAQVTEGGLFGDRAYALFDPTAGKVVSAKNPRKWPRLFEFRATFIDPPQVGQDVPPVRITLPDGTTVISGKSEFANVLSESLGRNVVLESTAPETPTLEEYWPDIEGLDHRNRVTDEAMPAGTFFDFATIHLLTTATIDRLRESYPEGRFEVRRFRPNIVVSPAVGPTGFVENGWIGRTLSVGPEVRLSVTGPCPRCVMTTLSQGDLPHDAGILRTAAQENKAHVGVYASVLRGGVIRHGDQIKIEE
jgi:uncharacterized protein YcbX